MTLMEVNLNDPIELREFAASSIIEASDHSSSVARVIQDARSQAREVARQAIDVFFLDPSDIDRGSRKDKALREYASLLQRVESNAREHHSKFYDLRLEMDQGLGFYLLHASRDNSMSVDEIEDLISRITVARDGHTTAITITDSVIDGIKASAGALPGLEDAVDDAATALRDVRDELDIGEAVLTRHIYTAKHLRNLIVHGQ